LLAQAGGGGTRYKRSDYNRSYSTVRVGAQWTHGRSRLALALSDQRHWLGGDLAIRSIGLEADVTRRLSGKAQVRLSGLGARLTNRFNPLESGTVWAGGAGLDLVLSDSWGVGVAGSYNRKLARDSAYSTRAVEAELSGWHDFGVATIAASATIGRLKADDRLFLLPERRMDHGRSFSATLGSRRIVVRGLTPTLTFTVDRERSNIAFYDTRRRALELRFKRAF